MLSAEAGKVVDISEVFAADGTTVVVNNLFYNVPARRKFLKKDSTEAMNVAALVEKVALSRPDISIQLLIDGEEKFTGAIGDIGTSSFYPPHHMTMGEGGAVYTNNPLLNKIARSMRDWGRDCVCPSGCDNICKHRFDRQYGELPLGYDHKYVYSHFGYNLKATDMQAAVGCAQLKKFPSFVERRKVNFKRLKAGIIEGLKANGLEDKLILPEACENSDPSWFGFLITCCEGTERNKVVQYLENNGVQTRMLFAGNLIKHPCFDEMRASGEGYRVVGELKNTDRIMNDTFWIGVYPGMTDEMIDYMAKKIVEALKA
jgi:CDP-6-deoxy-D-xylo-4-hexulose-3-dehydrase